LDTAVDNQVAPPPVWGVEICDFCTARAHAMYYKESLILTFCGHHSDKFGPQLLEQEWEVTEIE
jgi:hypothetical protein